MPELAFLDALTAYFTGPAGLTPAPASVGIQNPTNGAPQPAIVLSLIDLERLDLGLAGGLTEVSSGALAVQAALDLADPVLAGPDPVHLVSPDRRTLTLPHGGLIRADALDGVLGAADLSITIDGVPVTLVAGVPGGGEMQADPTIGQITFGTALPGSGTLVADYYLGIWERQTVTITGRLLLDVWSNDLTQITGTSATAVRSLIAPEGGGLPGLKKAALVSLGTVEPFKNNGAPNKRRAELVFEYEHIVDRPVSSGGLIATIPITTRTPGQTRDPVSGALTDTIAIETD